MGKNIKISIGILLALAVSRFIPHPPNFTSLLALSFYIPAIFGIKFIPIVMLCYLITDIFIGFSTSGNSKNIVNVIEKCKKLSIKFYVFTGISGGECKKYNENVIRFPSDNVAIIQQLHITVGHILCHLVDKELLDNE